MLSSHFFKFIFHQNNVSLFFIVFSWFFQRTGFQRTGNPSIFIAGHPSMNSLMEIHHWYSLWTINEFIDGPSMNVVPFLWFPFLGTFFRGRGLVRRRPRSICRWFGEKWLEASGRDRRVRATIRCRVHSCRTCYAPLGSYRANKLKKLDKK